MSRVRRVSRRPGTRLVIPKIGVPRKIAVSLRLARDCVQRGRSHDRSRGCLRREDVLRAVVTRQQTEVGAWFLWAGRLGARHSVKSNQFFSAGLYSVLLTHYCRLDPERPWVARVIRGPVFRNSPSTAEADCSRVRYRFPGTSCLPIRLSTEGRLQGNGQRRKRSTSIS